MRLDNYVKFSILYSTMHVLMPNYVPLDYSYVVYWNILQGLVMTLITVCFVLPPRGVKVVYPSFFYLALICTFTLSLALHHFYISMCFQEYYHSFIFIQGFFKNLSSLAFLAIMPIRCYVLGHYIFSPEQSVHRTNIISIPHITAFFIIFAINITVSERQNNASTASITDLFQYGSTIQSVVLIGVYVYDIGINYFSKYLMHKMLDGMLTTTDPLEMKHLAEKYPTNDNREGISPGFWSIMQNLTFSRINFTMALLIVAESLNICRQFNALIFHLVFPVQLVAYIVLFKPAMDSRIPD